MDYSALFDSIAYRFKNIDILKLALTHRSINIVNNERLEFLGDAILNVVISEVVYGNFPSQNEGTLTQYRSFLVQERQLEILAKGFQLSNYLMVSSSDPCIAHQPSILADTLEALIAAIYLDSQAFNIVRQCLIIWYQSLLKNMPSLQCIKDPKTRLQEYLQASGYPLASYVLEEAIHSGQSFHIICHTLLPQYQSHGVGRTRRKAEQAAAQAWLDQHTHEG
jgi:ribonuclease III